MTPPGSHLVSVTTGHRDEKPVIPLNLPKPPPRPARAPSYPIPLRASTHAPTT
ncbi:hypothetical protein C8035_v008955 [Colletotrichum spinosum]|uniref:Uncharacterized protein n=1 Tax=Colletotrichum spinosum TaxID=1347390 RepID=A0A4R8QEH9_9PEZI|nr:hypothetical protein C8035_v008955 [Colletotrichum spinosum]